MKIEIELSDREAQLLKEWCISSGQCGPSLQERIRYILDDWCMFLDRQEDQRRRAELYIAFGLPDPRTHIDDDIPF